MGDGPVGRNRSQEASPQFAARLKHPWFEVNPVGNVDDTMIDVVGKLVESVQADMHVYAFGGGVGRVRGQSGLKGSGSGFGSVDGRSGGCGAG